MPKTIATSRGTLASGKIPLAAFMEAFLPLEERRIKNIYNELCRIGGKNHVSARLIERLRHDVLSGKIAFDVIGSSKSDGEDWDLDPYRDALCIKTGMHRKGDRSIILLRVDEDETPSKLAAQIYERYADLFSVDKNYVISKGRGNQEEVRKPA